MSIPEQISSARKIRSVCFAAALSLAGLLPCSSQAADKQERTVLGKWRLTAALDASEITSIDEAEARQLVGKTMRVRPESVQFGSRKCPPPDLDAERVEPRLYLREQAHASAGKLGLPTPVTVVNLGCTIAFIKGRDHLVIHWDGWFFDAVRQK